MRAVFLASLLSGVVLCGEEWFNPRVYALYADACLNLYSGEVDVAIEEVKECIKLDPGSWEPEFLLGKCYLKKGDKGKFLAQLFRAEIKGAEDSQIRHMFLRSYELTESKVRTEALERAVEESLESKEKIAPKMVISLVELFSAAGDRKKAKQWLEKARKLRLKEAGMHWRLALMSSRLGAWEIAVEQTEFFLNRSRLEPAVEARALEFLAQCAEKARLEGRAEEARKRAIELLTDYCSAIKEKEKLVDARRVMARILADSKKYKQAVSILRECAEELQKEKKAEVLNELAGVYDTWGKSEKAEKAYLEALKLAPGSHLIKNNLSYFYSVKEKNLAEALKLIKEAVATLRAESGESNGAYLDTLGWVLFKLERKQEALKYLERAVRLEPSSEIYDHLGDVYMSLGRKEEAKKAWEEALQLNPLDEKIRNKLLPASKE